MAKQPIKNNTATVDAPSAPKNIFLHLFAFVALYISAVSFGSLLFNYINRRFPDRLAPYYFYEGFSSSLRWAIASLVIVYPLYLIAVWYMKREFSRFPELEASRIRKWLTYFTLFAAAVAIITDLVTLLYNFLGGELSIRFVLKVLVVLFIAGIVFLYYLFDARGKAMPRVRIFAIGVSALVALAVIYGFYLAGSPQTQRLRKFDEQRTQHLHTIYYQVRNFWETRNGLPATLDDIKKLDPFTEIPRDPENDAPYEYHIIGENTYELCATFSLSNAVDAKKSGVPAPVREPFGQYDGFDRLLNHSAGRNCFPIELTRVPKEIKDAIR